jgi:hypothetical protein
MAAGGERRLLFDVRGKRKHVIRVVYAILALLMGASLFLVVGPLNVGELIGTGSSSSASKVFDEQVERIERRLARNPKDDQLLLVLTRAQINAGNAKIEPVAEGETPRVNAEARREFEAALEAWSRYLEQAGEEPSATLAQLVASTSFRLAESSTSLPETQENVAAATRAQRIAAEQRPTLNSLSTLAIYEFFNGEFAAADRTTKEAVAKAVGKTQAKSVENQLAEYRKRGKEFEKQRKQLAKVEKEANKEQLTNPFQGLGGSPSGVPGG